MAISNPEVEAVHEVDLGFLAKLQKHDIVVAPLLSIFLFVFCNTNVSLSQLRDRVQPRSYVSSMILMVRLEDDHMKMISRKDAKDFIIA